MEIDKEIKVGDFVNIDFTHSSSFVALEVLYIPSNTGDSWRLVSRTGDVHYVQIFETMSRIDKGEHHIYCIGKFDKEG